MRIIELKDRTIEVETCAECPFCSHDPHYSMSHDSGYDCHFLGRVADDGAIERYNERVEEIKESGASLFPIDEDPPENPMRIKDECPLKHKENEKD